MGKGVEYFKIYGIPTHTHTHTQTENENDWTNGNGDDDENKSDDENLRLSSRTKNETQNESCELFIFIRETGKKEFPPSYSRVLNEMRKRPSSSPSHHHHQQFQTKWYLYVHLYFCYSNLRQSFGKFSSLSDGNGYVEKNDMENGTQYNHIKMREREPWL